MLSSHPARDKGGVANQDLRFQSLYVLHYPIHSHNHSSTTHPTTIVTFPDLMANLVGLKVVPSAPSNGFPPVHPSVRSSPLQQTNVRLIPPSWLFLPSCLEKQTGTYDIRSRSQLLIRRSRVQSLIHVVQ